MLNLLNYAINIQNKVNRLQNESFRGKLRKFPTRSNPWAFPKWRFHNKSTYVYWLMPNLKNFDLKSIIFNNNSFNVHFMPTWLIRRSNS
jgi:hypothetical protein